MMMSGGFGLLGIFGFALMAAQIVGVIGLAKAGRTTDWWLMAIGTACSLIGSTLSIVMMLSAFAGLAKSSSFASGLTSSFMIFGGLSGLGGLLFAAGFAMHGTRAARISGRQSELEMLVKAQTEEIQRLSARS